MSSVLKLSLLATFSSIALFALACNDHVFEVIQTCSARLVGDDVPIGEDRPADILLVIDNSGSMCEEQDNLVANFFDPNCPITDLNNVPSEYRNPGPGLVEQLSQDCGFIQILAAYDNDFHVGVITTDVGQCDNRFGFAENTAVADYICGGQNFPDWGRHPQRGCLQAPRDSNGDREFLFISKSDTEIGSKFQRTLENVRTFGSGYERGLDAMEDFLSPNASKAPGCDGDRDAFIRDNAKLVVIFLSDEEDCSHADGAYGFPDENAGESCDHPTETPAAGVSPTSCYDEPNKLAPISRYASFLSQFKGPQNIQDISVAVIAGGVFEGAPETSPVVAGGCRIQSGLPDANCKPSFGNSILNNPGDVCDPANDPPCCEADSGGRYFEMAAAMPSGQALTNSICYDSFRSTMVSIARFIARKDSVLLTEDPQSVDAIDVRIVQKGQPDRVVTHIADDCDPSAPGTPCPDGWTLEGGRTIRLYGTGVPLPGEELQIKALASFAGGNCGFDQ